MNESVGTGAVTRLALAALFPEIRGPAQQPAQAARHQAPAAPVRVQLTAYSGITVQRGQRLRAIAASPGVPLSALEASNPQLANPNLIFPGPEHLSTSPGRSTDWAGRKVKADPIASTAPPHRAATAPGASPSV